MAFQKNRDYAAEIVRAVSERAPKETVGQLLTERNEKIAASRDHYASIGVSPDDAYASMARAYLRQDDPGPLSAQGTASRDRETVPPSDAPSDAPSAYRDRPAYGSDTAPIFSTSAGRGLDARASGSVGAASGDPSADRSRADLSGVAGSARDAFEIERQRSDASIDYATSQAVDAAARALDDARARYGDQMAQIDLDEARARDAQALYAELRGDRGGIGAAQYDSISNAAARQRRAVQDARIRMAADTRRQISQLRAQGAYEKADKALALTQSYLSKLSDLEKWAAEYRMKEDQFRTGLDQWLANYRLQLRKMEIGQEQWQSEADYKRWRAEMSDRQWDLSRQDGLSQKAIDNAYREQTRQDDLSQKAVDNAYREQTRRDRLEQRQVVGK